MTYWLVLFTTSCFANLLGLNISSAFNSVVTIYILIPFIIIPQLLFSGVLVKFDKLHLSGFTSREYVPVIGDAMMARWSFEALAVEQFSHNRFEKPFFKYDMEVSRYEYYASFLTDKLKNDLVVCNKYRDSADYSEIVRSRLNRLVLYIDQVSGSDKIVPGQWINELVPGKFNAATSLQASRYLDSAKRIFHNNRKTAIADKDAVSKSLENAIGKAGVVKLRDNYENKKLIQIVLDQEPGEKTIDTGDKIIQKYNPGYMKATSKLGRAHFYAPVKKVGNIETGTYWFNIAVIWFVILILYITLYFNVFPKLTTSFGSMRLKERKTELTLPNPPCRGYGN